MLRPLKHAEGTIVINLHRGALGTARFPGTIVLNGGDFLNRAEPQIDGARFVLFRRCR